MLHETRMVLTEKVGQEYVWSALHDIDYAIRRRKNLHIGLSVYIPDAFIRIEWFYNKSIKKILEANGFEIFENFNIHQDTNLVYIRHITDISEKILRRRLRQLILKI